jgi:hypothetical protein
MTLENPTSLPPTVIDTRVVWAFSVASWLLMTDAVVAPEHATNAKLAGVWLAAQTSE